MKLKMPSSVKAVMKSVQLDIHKNAPLILTIAGVTGLVTTTVLAVKVTPRALELIEKEKHIRKETGNTEELTKLDIVKTTWTCYVPVVISGTAAAACIIGANSINGRRNVALATAYSLSESALSEYKSKVVETLGEKKEKEQIHDEIMKDRIKKDPPRGNQVIMAGGDTLCYDSLTGRYFRSSIEKVKAVTNDLNYSMLTEMYIKLNDYYDELRIPYAEVGDYLAWDVEDGKIEPIFTAQMTDEGVPCLVVSFQNPPKYRDYL